MVGEDGGHVVSRSQRNGCFSRIQCVTSKAGIMILLWTFMVAFVLGVVFGLTSYRTFVLLTYLSVQDVLPTLLAVYAVGAVVYMFFPIAGFVADVYCGRYKVIRFSVWLLWIALLLISLYAIVSSFTISTLNEHGIIIVSVVASVALLVFAVGISAFQANIIQFGTDQLQDASAGELSAFIRWYVWTSYLGSRMAVLFFILTFTCLDDIDSYVVAVKVFLGFVTIIFGIILLRNCCCPRGFWIDNRIVDNPYKTVLKVLLFAWKHNHPLQRSAFTYWEDNIPSRIDLAKSKYGGPFTTEQVEDVKTFLQMFAVLLANSIFFVTIMPSQFINDNHFLPKYNGMDPCGLESVVTDNYILTTGVVIVSIPLYECCIGPLLRRHNVLPFRSMFKRLGAAQILILASIIYYFLVDTIGHAITDPNPSCMFGATRESEKIQIHRAVLIIPDVLTGLANVLFYTTVNEFICAQSPHSMKGLLLGSFYGLQGLFSFVGVAIIVPFAKGSFDSHHPTNPSCGFGYFLLNTLLAAIGVVVFCEVAVRYKYRERGESYNPRPFVEAYYECNSVWCIVASAWVIITVYSGTIIYMFNLFGILWYKSCILSVVCAPHGV